MGKIHLKTISSGDVPNSTTPAWFLKMWKALLGVRIGSTYVILETAPFVPATFAEPCGTLPQRRLAEPSQNSPSTAPRIPVTLLEPLWNPRGARPCVRGTLAEPSRNLGEPWRNPAEPFLRVAPDHAGISGLRPQRFQLWGTKQMFISPNQWKAKFPTKLRSIVVCSHHTARDASCHLLLLTSRKSTWFALNQTCEPKARLAQEMEYIYSCFFQRPGTACLKTNL